MQVITCTALYRLLVRSRPEEEMPFEQLCVVLPRDMRFKAGRQRDAALNIVFRGRVVKANGQRPAYLS